MLSFALAGVGFELQSPSSRILAAARELFGGYHGKTDQTWRLFCAEAHPMTFLAPPALALERQGSHVRVTLGAMFSGDIDLATHSARVTLGALPDSFSSGGLQNLVRVCLVLALAPKGGLLLHASGGVWAGKARAFFGVSGAGKSTLARHFSSLLSDEIICIDGDGVAHRAPFTGETLPPAEPLSAPLDALYAIEQNAELQACPLTDLRPLLRCVVHVDRDRELTRMLLDNAACLATRVPLYTLRVPLLSSEAALLAVLDRR